MADESIVVEVQDKVSPSIKVKIDAIGASAIAADERIMQLQGNLRRLGGSGRATDQLRSSSERLTGAHKAAVDASAKLTRQQEAQARSAVALARAQDKATASSLKSNAALARAQSAFRQRGGSGGGGSFVGGAARGLSTVTGGGGMVGQLGRAALSTGGMAAAGGVIGVGAVAGLAVAADGYNKLYNSLQNVRGAAGQVGPLIEKVTAIANKTAQPVEESAMAFARFDRALAALGKTQQESLQFTENVQMMLFRYGKTGSEAASATLQLTQAMGKGKLDGDEFRSVMENLPELGTEIAKTLGVTRGELKELAPQGKITGDVIFNAMKNAEETLRAMPEPLSTLDASFTRLGNSSKTFFGELSIAQGIVKGLTGAIDSLAEALESLPVKDKEKPGDPIGLSDEAVENMFKGVKAEKEFQALREKWKTERAERTKTISELTGEAEKETRRSVELLGMKERERFIETELDKIRKEGEKAGITIYDDDLSTQRGLLGQQFDLQQKDKKGEKTVDRAKELLKITTELANERTRMTQLAPERELSARFDSVSESLAQKKITLTEEESAAIREQMRTIQEFLPIQAARDQVYQDATSAQRDFNATFDAADQLFLEGSIAEDQYIRITNRASEEFKKATDVAYEYNRAQEDQLKLSKMSAREREIETALLDEMNRRRQEGVEMTDEQSKAERRRLTAIRDLNEYQSIREGFLSTDEDIRKQRVEIQVMSDLRDEGRLRATKIEEAAGQSVGSATWEGSLAEVKQREYDYIDELRQKDLISEQEASARKIQAWQAEHSAKLDVANSFFSNFTGMQRSSWKEMAAIGKAGAVAQATIQTYQAATGAYAAMSAIPVVGPALGAAAAAAAIASGLANVDAILSTNTGFRSGGYTGDGGVDDVAGVVHGREFVFDAASTARIGRGNLEQMRQGSAPAQSGTPAQINIAVFDSRESAEEWLSGREGEKRIVEVVTNNRKSLKKALG